MISFGKHIQEIFSRNEVYSGPFFVIDKKQVEERAESFKKSFSIFPKHKFLYSYKTNSLQDVCTLLRKMGFGAEVVSGAELAYAIGDGHAGSDIFFDGPVKSAKEIREAVLRQAVIQVDSIQEWNIIKTNHLRDIKNIKIGVRLSHNYESGQLSRFGFTSDEFHNLYNDMLSVGAEISGVHLHIGSNILQIERYLNEIDRYVDILKSVVGNSRNHFPWIDLGGGFPALSNREGQSIPNLSMWAARLLTHMVSKGLDVTKFTLVLEPGRHLTEDAGFLFCRVASFKNRGLESILTLDSGLNHVRSFHGWKHQIFHLENDNDSVKVPYKVYGSNCYESDLFHPGLFLSKGIEVGDWFMISNVGGYDIPSITPWIRPHPPIFFYENDSLRLVRPGSSDIETRIRV